MKFAIIFLLFTVRILAMLHHSFVLLRLAWLPGKFATTHITMDMFLNLRLSITLLFLVKTPLYLVLDSWTRILLLEHGRWVHTIMVRPWCIALVICAPILLLIYLSTLAVYISKDWIAPLHGGLSKLSRRRSSTSLLHLVLIPFDARCMTRMMSPSCVLISRFRCRVFVHKKQWRRFLEFGSFRLFFKPSQYLWISNITLHFL